MSADLLRRAANKIEETIQWGDQPWYTAETLFREVGMFDADEAAHIALWSPDLAVLVADSLRRAGEVYGAHVEGYLRTGHSGEGAREAAAKVVRRELVLARRILGEDA